MEETLANWVECKAHDTGQSVFVNLDMVVSVSSNGVATVITYGGGVDSAIIVQGSPHAVLAQQVVH